MKREKLKMKEQKFIFSSYKTERIDFIFGWCSKELEVKSIQSHHLHLDKEPLLLSISFTIYFSPCPSTKSLVSLAVGLLQNTSQLISNISLETCSLTLMLLHPPF